MSKRVAKSRIPPTYLIQSVETSDVGAGVVTDRQIHTRTHTHTTSTVTLVRMRGNVCCPVNLKYEV